MIGLLTGKIISADQNPIIIDVHGVGYAISIPEQYLTKLKIQSTGTFFVHTYVREDNIALYGFTTQKELTLFRMLLNVSGIGPRTALAMINRGVSNVIHAVSSADVDFFSTIPRVGRKSAQKVIIELKPKLGSMTDLDLSGKQETETKQLIDVLLRMGFERNEALSAIKKLEAKDKTLEQKIRSALKYLGKS